MVLLSPTSGLQKDINYYVSVTGDWKASVKARRLLLYIEKSANLF